MAKTCTTCNVTFEDVVANFRKLSSAPDGYKYRCKSCMKAYDAEYRQENKDKIEAKAKKHLKDNRDKINERNRRWKKEHKEQTATSRARYKSENKDKVNSNTAKRRAMKKNACPNWTPLASVQQFYTQAQLMTNMMNEEYHVDHIEPLVNSMVCGLHVPANLRVMKGLENAGKGNKFKPYGFDFTTGLYYELS